jgi:hypothetical protein
MEVMGEYGGKWTERRRRQTSQASEASVPSLAKEGMVMSGQWAGIVQPMSALGVRRMLSGLREDGETAVTTLSVRPVGTDESFAPSM